MAIGPWAFLRRLPNPSHSLTPTINFGDTMTTDTDTNAARLAEMLSGIRVTLDGLRAEVSALRSERMILPAGPFSGQRFFTVKEAANVLARDEYTVREWCRLGQVNAHKGGRCGKHAVWRIAVEEIQRYREDGLLPIDPERNTGGHRRRA